MAMTVTSSMSVKPLSRAEADRGVPAGGHVPLRRGRGELVVSRRRGLARSATSASGSGSVAASAAASSEDELLCAIERDLEVVSIRRRVCRGLTVDEIGEHEVDERPREGLHLEELAVVDRVGNLVASALADELRDAGVRDHHLDGRDAATADAWEKPLADDAAQDAGEDRDHLRLFLGREELDHAADGLGGIQRVERRTRGA